MRPAVEIAQSQHMLTSARDIDDRKQRRRLTRRGRQRTNTALHQRNLLLQPGERRIAKTRVHRRTLLQVKHIRQFICTVVFECRRLHKRHRAALSIARNIPTLNALRRHRRVLQFFVVHRNTFFLNNFS